MRRHRALAALAACCLAACRPEAPAPTPLPDGISAPETEAGNEFLAALLESASDRSVTGAAVLTSDDGKLVLAVALDGLAPGSYTVHVHEYDDCRRPGPRFSLPGDVEFSPDGRVISWPAAYWALSRADVRAGVWQAPGR